MEVCSNQVETLTEEINKLSTTNDEKFTSQFFGKIVLHAENFQLVENRQLAVLILTKLCTLLLGSRKSKTRETDSEARIINNREIAGLQYLGGGIIRNLYSALRKSKKWKSEEFQNMMAVVKLFQNEEKPTSQKLISALDRNGLWYITDNLQGILVQAEKLFCSAIRNRADVRKIDHKQIVQSLIENPQIQELYENAAQNCDIEVTLGCKKYVLKRILELFVRIRSFNYAKDTVQRFRAKNTTVKKPLRKTLKAVSENIVDKCNK